MCYKDHPSGSLEERLKGAIPEAGKLREYCSKDGRGLNCKITEGGIDIQELELKKVWHNLLKSLLLACPRWVSG